MKVFAMGPLFAKFGLAAVYAQVASAAAWTTPLLPHHYYGAPRLLSLEQQKSPSQQQQHPIYYRSNALDVKTDTKVPYLPTMSEALAAEPFLSHMSRLVRESGLAALLDRSRGVTLFAPVNRKFRAWDLAAGELSVPLEAQAVSNHVVPEVVHASELEEGQVTFPTLRGVPLTLKAAARPANTLNSRLGFLEIPQISIHLNDSSPVYLLTAPEPLQTANGPIYAVESPLVAAEDEMPIMETVVLNAQRDPSEVGGTARAGKQPLAAASAASALAARSANLLSTLTQRSPSANLQHQAATARLAASEATGVTQGATTLAAASSGHAG